MSQRPILGRGLASLLFRESDHVPAIGVRGVQAVQSVRARLRVEPAQLYVAVTGGARVSAEPGCDSDLPQSSSRVPQPDAEGRRIAGPGPPSRNALFGPIAFGERIEQLRSGPAPMVFVGHERSNRDEDGLGVDHGLIRLLLVSIKGTSKSPSRGIGALSGMPKPLEVGHATRFAQTNARQFSQAPNHGIQKRAEYLRTRFVEG